MYSISLGTLATNALMHVHTLDLRNDIKSVQGQCPSCTMQVRSSETHSHSPNTTCEDSDDRETASLCVRQFETSRHWLSKCTLSKLAYKVRSSPSHRSQLSKSIIVPVLSRAHSPHPSHPGASSPTHVPLSNLSQRMRGNTALVRSHSLHRHTMHTT